MEDLEKIKDMCQIFITSGMFPDVKTTAQAVVKVLTGRELGIPPIASMRTIDVVGGNIFIRPILFAAMINKSEKYSYKVKFSSNERCEIEFYGDGGLLGTSSYTIEDAKQQGLYSKANWSKVPKIMLFYRALGNGTRMYCPDIFNLPVYITGVEDIDDELTSADIVKSSIMKSKKINLIKENETTENNTVVAARLTDNNQETEKSNTRPYSPGELKTKMNERANKISQESITEYTRRQVVLSIKALSEDDEDRHKILEYFFGIKSSKDLTEGQGKAMIEWIKAKRDETGIYVPDYYAITEFTNLMEVL